MLYMQNEKLENKVRGCILGGAIGDALGYPIEFDEYADIISEYGNSGITFKNFNDKVNVSDDTQMTLFTAKGLLMKGNQLDNVWNCYQEWLDTQFKKNKNELSYQPVSELMNYPEMYASREPGGTCISSICFNQRGTIKKPLNDSKGCGGVMRIAPVGLIVRDELECLKVASQISVLTHGHIMSTMASALMAEIIHYEFLGKSIEIAISDALKIFEKYFKDAPQFNDFIKLQYQALSQANNSKGDFENITDIGGGWIAEETLAIALYVSKKYQSDPQQGVEVAVNHSGDSDSTGALVGQILGTALGDKWIPSKFVENIDILKPLSLVIDQINSSLKV